MVKAFNGGIHVRITYVYFSMKLSFEDEYWLLKKENYFKIVLLENQEDSGEYTE